jgi:hypothetical protein
MKNCPRRNSLLSTDEDGFIFCNNETTSFTFNKQNKKLNYYCFSQISYDNQFIVNNKYTVFNGKKGTRIFTNNSDLIILKFKIDPYISIEKLESLLILK